MDTQQFLAEFGHIANAPGRGAVAGACAPANYQWAYYKP
jgi:hypothetical protein